MPLSPPNPSNRHKPCDNAAEHSPNTIHLHDVVPLDTPDLCVQTIFPTTTQCVCVCANAECHYIRRLFILIVIGMTTCISFVISTIRIRSWMFWKRFVVATPESCKRCIAHETYCAFHGFLMECDHRLLTLFSINMLQTHTTTTDKGRNNTQLQWVRHIRWKKASAI